MSEKSAGIIDLKARKNKLQVYNDLSNIYRNVFEVLKQFLYCVERFCIVLSDHYQHLCTGPYVIENRGKFKDLTPGKIWANQRSSFFKQLYSAAITELLQHAFGQHLTAGDLRTRYGYHQMENTGSRLFTEVKACWTGLISGWVTI